MKIKRGGGLSVYGPGISIILTGEEVANAINAWLCAHSVHITGARTISVNDRLCDTGEVYVDPQGSVIFEGKSILGARSTDRK